MVLYIFLVGIFVYKLYNNLVVQFSIYIVVMFRFSRFLLNNRVVYDFLFFICKEYVIWEKIGSEFCYLVFKQFRVSQVLRFGYGFLEEGLKIFGIYLVNFGLLILFNQ